ncbi:unnamed protein product [Linum tenue]|uniref:F-box domain-containing protein n=1 Tax=Linum tenue TaxID=586396 RepID=A0AAV0NJJ0_9ROSI|nr:unnamed protein product [Linum tenue]
MMKRACCSCELSTADRISNLPANVTDQILTSMPIKEAAKASLWSKKWRNRWRSIPALVFDRKFGRIPLASPSQVKLNKLMMKVYRVLLLHDGPIDKFVLSVPGLRPCPEIEHIILYLSDKVTDEFSLRFGECRKVDPSGEKRVWAPGTGPVIQTSLTVGFSKLTALELKEVALASDFFEKFITKCPLLEKLTLLNCHGFESPKLVAPRLKALYFHSRFLVSFSFKCTPLLSLVSMLDPDEDDYESNVVIEGDDMDMVNVFASLPALKQLNLGLELLISLMGSIPVRLPTLLQHLTVLEIPKIILSCLKDARILVCLIMSSPNLRCLTIRHDMGYQRSRPTTLIDSIQMLLEAAELDPYGTNGCLGCLESLNIHNGPGSESQIELELVKFVLAKAPQLRRVYIRPSRNMGHYRVASHLKTMIGFKHASREAEIIYDWDERSVH